MIWGGFPHLTPPLGNPGNLDTPVVPFADVFGYTWPQIRRSISETSATLRFTIRSNASLASSECCTFVTESVTCSCFGRSVKTAPFERTSAPQISLLQYIGCKVIVCSMHFTSLIVLVDGRSNSMTSPDIAITLMWDCIRSFPCALPGTALP